MPTSFNSQYDRLKLALGKNTQVEIAVTLNIHQSSISEAKRRGSMPDSWKMAALRIYGINPLWIETGRGGMHSLASAACPISLHDIDSRILLAEISNRLKAVAPN